MINMDKEIWKDIPNYEGRYQVSNYGNIRSLNHNQKGIVKEIKKRLLRGYYYVRLQKNGQKEEFKIHRIVYAVFVGELPKCILKGDGNKIMVVNHKDENKLNNRADNLEVISYTQNINYGKNSVIRSVHQYDKNGILVKTWRSMTDAESDGFNKSAICLCCTGRIKTHKGYKWVYADNKLNRRTKKMKQ